jgi:hypothetical protein
VTLPPAPAARPPDTMKVRARLRALWLALLLAAAVGCVSLGMYGDTPEDTLRSHQIFLSLFLCLAVLSVVLAVRSFGRGVDADGDGVVVRKMFRAISIPWREPAAIDFNAAIDFKEDPEVWDITGCSASWYSSARTDLGSPPRRQAVEQNPASTCSNSGKVCSRCDPLP